MKYHITNIYGGGRDSYISKVQEHYAASARELGFLEMGIYIYPVSSDTPEELDKRQDGIIAAVEKDDVVLFQLPTGNGCEFEKKLLFRLKAYGAKVVMMLHSVPEWDDIYYFNYADEIIVSSPRDKKTLESKFVTIPEIIAKALTLNQSKMLVKKQLLEMVSGFTQEEDEDPCNDDSSVVQVCFGLHDKTGEYCRYVGTTMLSVIENTEAKVCFHILHDETLTETNRNRLKKTAESGCCSIVFHKMDMQSIEEMNNQAINRFTIGSMYRLIAPETLACEKVIYLDADLLFLKDINELWNCRMGNYTLAAVRDVGFERGVEPACPIRNGEIEKDKYINSGVLVMNLGRIRERRNLLSDVIDYIEKHPESKYPDQDALNVIFKNDIFYLDSSWNSFVRYERQNSSDFYGKVYHYAGQPCIYYESPMEYDKEYLNIQSRTPWGYEFLGKEIMRGYSSVFDKLFCLQKFISRLLFGNKKVYICGNAVLRCIEDILNVNLENNGNFVLLNNVEEIKGCNCNEVLVLISLDEDYYNNVKRLESMGYRSRENYFVIQDFLTFCQGGYA